MNEKEIAAIGKIVATLAIMICFLFFLTPFGQMAYNWVNGTMHEPRTFTSIVFIIVLAIILLPVMMKKSEKKEEKKEEKKS